MNLSTRLATLIADRGFTVAEVARLTNMHRQAVHKIVSGGTANPSAMTIQKIADAIGVTMSELFEDTRVEISERESREAEGQRD